jgi:hypothetical protein
MTDEREQHGLSEAELAAEDGTALPDKEVVSILDLNADIDLAIDAAAPIDLAVAANANVAAPIDAAASANILSDGSTAQALGDQGVIIDQGIDADATANATQASGIDQDNDVIDDGTGDGTSDHGEVTTNTSADALGGDLLDVNVNVDGDVDVAAPIDGAVAANANVAAPINAGVAANVGSVDSDAIAISQQDAIINQDIEGSAEANADQQSDITQ